MYILVLLNCYGVFLSFPFFILKRLTRVFFENSHSISHRRQKYHEGVLKHIKAMMLWTMLCVIVKSTEVNWLEICAWLGVCVWKWPLLKGLFLSQLCDTIGSHCCGLLKKEEVPWPELADPPIFLHFVLSCTIGSENSESTDPKMKSL